MMAKQGHNVTCYNRAGHHVSGNEFDKKIEKEYKGVKLKTVWTIDKKGLAQIPFVGFHDATILEKSCMVINLDIRANIFKNTFLSLQGGYIWTDRELDFKTLDLSPKYYGAAVELGYDAFIGPVKAKVQWSNFLKWQAYVSAGFDF